MAGSQEIGAKLLGFFPEQAEFNKFIACLLYTSDAADD